MNQLVNKDYLEELKAKYSTMLLVLILSLAVNVGLLIALTVATRYIVAN